jgi:hypothetical protein
MNKPFTCKLDIVNIPNDHSFISYYKLNMP